jgi:hypothetical protein
MLGSSSSSVRRMPGHRGLYQVHQASGPTFAMTASVSSVLTGGVESNNRTKLAPLLLFCNSQ